MYIKMNENEKKERYFTLKRKGIAAIVCVAASLLWVILWFIFPMEFYSLFFASNIGSTLFLAGLAAAVTFPACYIGTKALSRDISVPVHLIINIIGMVGCIFLYSIFRYTAVWWVIIGIIFHIAATAAVFVLAPEIKVNRVKNTKSRLSVIIGGIICAVCSDSIYLILFNILLETFRE